IATGDREPKQFKHQREHQRQYDEEDENPYVFNVEDFTPMFKNEHGAIYSLQKFSERSKLLSGIENFRVAAAKANPLTFLTPTHFDAEVVLVVTRGRGAITLIGEKRESFNIERGDVIRVQAGTTVYWINTDENDELRTVCLLKTVNFPSEYTPFYAASAGEASFYSALSPELLEAALKTDKEMLEHIMSTDHTEVIVKASKEQIQALSQEEEGRGNSTAPFNLLDMQPLVHNNYGQIFYVSPTEYRALEDLDIGVGFVNITKGSMLGPLYNSESTAIIMVLDGEGYFEMVGPRTKSSVQTGPTNKKLSSSLRHGSVIVSPAGYPIAMVASRKNDLIAVCFGTNAKGNIKYPLAGKNNIVNKMKSEAIELTFGVPAKEVEEIFEKETDYLLFPGPSQQEKQGRADA
ncbi:hypothetical protein MANES_05G079000v8, partial [Manihot esculenta]